MSLPDTRRAQEALRSLDLLVAIGGKQLITEVPAVYMWVLIFDARDYAKGAAIATILLAGISLLIIPYIVFTVRAGTPPAPSGRAAGRPSPPWSPGGRAPRPAPRPARPW